MAQSDPIWQRAKAELTLSDRSNVRDNFLWEHTLRVVRAARMLLEVPEIAAQSVDRTALQAAALFHGVGWALQCRDGLASRWEVLTRPTTEAQRDLSANWLARNGREYLSDRTLVLACTAIRLSNSRDAGTAESRVLTDAENLDSVGPLAFWQLVRRHSAEGKGVQAGVEAWNRQKEYNFWEARIKDGFRSEAARRIAYNRLDALQAFVEALCTHHRADDVAELIGRSAGEFEPSLDHAL